MAKGLILSVGGSEEPLVKTILEHKPDYICFFCSQGSVDIVRKAKDEVVEKSSEQIVKNDFKVLVDDPNDVVHCYEKARECLRKLEEWGISPEETIVDFTGGTKSMSVALSLAAIRLGPCTFSYVGGGERTKEGLGVVVSGTEKIYENVNPWSFFAIEERRRIAEAFNSYQFTAALEATENLLERQNLDKKQRHFLEIVKLLCEAYSNWDRFEHEKATTPLKKATEKLESYVEYGTHESYKPFLEEVKNNLQWLQSIQEDTHGFSHPARFLLLDLISNAVRRIEEGKYDDAVARLYRALEMHGQICLREKPLQIESASDVPENKLPESLREEFVRKYKQEGQIKLPLRAVFDLLAEAGHEQGKRFKEQEEEIEKILHARNHSILAHGISPIGKEKCEKLLNLILNFLDCKDLTEKKAGIKFAKMPVE